MANRFLQPRSVSLPSQGAYQFVPTFFVREADSAAALEALLNVESGVQATDPDNYWVIEEIEYQVTVTKLASGNKPAQMKYSAMIWATRVEII